MSKKRVFEIAYTSCSKGYLFVSTILQHLYTNIILKDLIKNKEKNCSSLLELYLKC